MHQVCLYETHTGVALKEQVVKDKESEQTRGQEFLLPLYVKGRVVSADALHTHASISASITASGGDYVLFAKGLDEYGDLVSDPRCVRRGSQSCTPAKVC